MTVHCSDGSVMKFREFESNLYYFDIFSSNSNNTSINACNPYSFMQSVANSKENFICHEIEEWIKLMSSITSWDNPLKSNFNAGFNRIHNCPLTADDAKCALAIYGPDITTVKGKATRKVVKHVPSFKCVDLPQSVLTHHSKVALCIDFMYINGNIFFHTISKNIQF
jgi:hypothetical protein